MGRAHGRAATASEWAARSLGSSPDLAVAEVLADAVDVPKVDLLRRRAAHGPVGLAALEVVIQVDERSQNAAGDGRAAAVVEMVVVVVARSVAEHLRSREP